MVLLFIYILRDHYAIVYQFHDPNWRELSLILINISPDMLQFNSRIEIASNTITYIFPNKILFPFNFKHISKGLFLRRNKLERACNNSKMP